MTCTALDILAGRQLFFKCENFQKIGAFKFRGAYNAIAKYVEGGGKGPVMNPLVTRASTPTCSCTSEAAKSHLDRRFCPSPHH